MNLISVMNLDGTMEAGKYIIPLSFCVTNCCKGKCKEFYQNVRQKERNKFYTCPHGMSVYLSPTGKIFSCMRERSTYQKDKAKVIHREERNYNPILDTQQLLTLIDASTENFETERILDEKRASLDSISHEVKQLNTQIKDHSDIILQTYKLDQDDVQLSASDIVTLQEKIRTIYVSSSMIASRFSLYDYEKNPQALTQGKAYPCNVYGKFDKIRRILKGYMRKSTVISINGGSFSHITAYPSFEMVPLLLLENSVKYSYGHGDEVTVDFLEEKAGSLIVTISSYSPYCSEEESSQIFDKGFRGKNARKISDGSGIGLYFVKMLCDLHNIQISAESDSNRISEISGVAYAPFKYTLTFNDTFHV